MEEPEMLDYLSDTSDGSTETLYDGPMEWMDSNGNINFVQRSDVSQLPPKRMFNQIKQYKNLVSLMRKVKKSEQLSVIFEECASYFRFPLTAHNKKTLMEKLNNFRKTYILKLKKYNRTWRDFQNHEKQWLESYITVPATWFSISPPDNSRPSKSKQKKTSKIEPECIPGQSKKFKDLTTRGKQKAVQKVTQQFSALPTPVIIKSAQHVLSKRGEKSSSLILKEIQTNFASSSEILSKIRSKITTQKKYSGDEALALLLEMSLSQLSYKRLRIQGIDRGSTIYPSWQEIADAKKNCYPANLKVTENLAKVPLQNLLDQTVERIFQLQWDLVLSYFESHQCQKTCILVGIYGFDGASGHSQYHQKFAEHSSNKSDETLFATTFTPLRLLSPSGQILWQNPGAQSTRFCRPLKLEFVKETAQKIIEEKNGLDSEINSLVPTKIKMENLDIHVNFDLSLTCIDGKCLMVVTGVTKSSQSCPICGSTPKTFNDVRNLQNSKFKPKFGTLFHGISPLHAWIRLMEFCLKLAYRKPGGSYPVTQPQDKKLYEETKRKIQQNLRDSMGILVDIVKQGAGTTNSGNTARTAFQNFKEFSSALNIDQTFVWNLYIILITISSQLPIDSEKFGNFCLETFNLYVAIYKWHPMSATLHKILVHGREIIENSKLPLGMMSEEGAESRNKIYRQDREFHARKMNRIFNLEDVFHRAFESSDPVISSIFLSSRNRNRKRLPLPTEALKLLTPPAIPLESVQDATQACQQPDSLDTSSNLEILSILDDFELEVESDEEDEEEG